MSLPLPRKNVCLRWLIVGVWVACSWLCINYPAHATPFGAEVLVQVPSPSVEDLEKLQQDLDRHRSGITQERDRLRHLEDAAKKRLTGLQQNSQTTGEQLQQIETQLQQVTQQLKQLQTQLGDAQFAYQQSATAAIARLRFLQRQPKIYGWALLLESQDLNQFLDRRRQLKLIYQADRKTLTQLKAAADRLNQQALAIAQKKNEIILLRQQIIAQKSDFETQLQEQKNLVTRLVSDRQALEAAQAQLKQDSEGISFLIQDRLAARPSGFPQILGTGRMAVPNEGPISSTFGWRMHPILGYERFHSGMDFASDYGSIIFAADSGVVIFAGWYGGYGNAVIIDHGNEISTLYAHASEILVMEGQAIQRGEAIAIVGSTGLSTGPHLHFEVRENGEPVDPLNYLS